MSTDARKKEIRSGASVKAAMNHLTRLFLHLRGFWLPRRHADRFRGWPAEREMYRLITLSHSTHEEAIQEETLALKGPQDVGKHHAC